MDDLTQASVEPPLGSEIPNHTSDTQSQPIESLWRFAVACFAFLSWLLLLLVGHQVNSEPARRLLSGLGQIRYATNSPVMTLNSSQPTNTSRVISFKLFVDGQEFAMGTNTLSAALGAPEQQRLEVSFANIIRALVVATLSWTWPNLILLASAASAFGALLARKPLASRGAMVHELSWSLINGFFVVLFLGCSQVFFGESVYKSLGLSDALQVQIKQDRYMNLAFFASLVGLFLGLAQKRLNSLPGKLPIIGPIFR